MTGMSRLGLRLAAFLAVTLTCAPAHAALLQLTNPNDLFPTDSLAWTDPEFTSYLPGDIVMTTNGVSATLGGATAFTVFSGSTYNADFLATDSVLSAFDANAGEVAGPIRITFGQDFAGAGAQIQPLLFGTFTATLSAYDALNNLLGTVTVNGSNNGSGDGSAAYIGFRSDLTNVRYLEFDGDPGLAINTVGLSPTPVPEPTTFALTGLGLALVCLARRRRRD
jgi:PEP-CTERM motif